METSFMAAAAAAHMMLLRNRRPHVLKLRYGQAAYA